MYLILITLVSFYVCFIIWKWRFIKFSWENNAFYAPILPVIGTTYLYFIYGCTDLISSISALGSKLGFPFNMWMVFEYYYFTKDPKDIKTVLYNLSAQNKASVYADIAYLFPNSLLTTHYKEWRVRRKEYMKSFKPSTLKQYCLDYFRNSTDLVKVFKTKKKEIAMSYDICNKHTFKNFFTTSVGLNQEPKTLELFSDNLLGFQDDFGNKLINPLIPIAIWYHLLPGGVRTANTIKDLRTVIKQIQDSKLQHRTDFKALVEDLDNPPFLDLMMSLKGTVINEENVFSDMVFVAAAATDTSGYTLLITLTFIGMFPEVQKKVYEEVMAVGSSLAFDDLSKLVYTGAVINETMRLFPVIPLIARVLEKDIDLGHKVIPKGSNFVVSIFDLHRDEKCWPNPLEFNPDRFLPENMSKIQSCSFIPFSTGPRDCLGKSQAMAMMKITTASIVRNFKIHSKHTSVKEFDCGSAITMKIRNPIDCRLTPRTHEL